jgi:hypothetical protein
MESLMRIKTGLFAFISILILSGCGSIVKKPEINHVKSIALISVYANDTVPEKKNRGKVSGWSDEIKQDVSSGFYKIYAKSLQGLGWKVIPMRNVVASKTYQANFRMATNTDSETANKVGGFLNKLAQMSESYNYFTPKGLHVMEINRSELHTTKYVNGKAVDVRHQLADLAKELNVDAVAVVQIDYCYEGGTFSIMGTGKGYMTAASTIHAVDRKGNLIIDMGDLGRCVDTNNRAESDTGYAMVGGNLVISFAKDDTVKKMFMEATEKNAAHTAAQIRKAMK